MKSLPRRQQAFYRFVYVGQPLQGHSPTDGKQSTEPSTTLTLEILSEDSTPSLSTPKASCRVGVEAGINLSIPDR